MEIKKHNLKGKNVNFVEATSYSRNSKFIPTAIIIHYTAGDDGDITVKFFSRKKARLSAHLVIHENGRITQMVPFNKKAYHAGKSFYDGKSNFNSFAIGIEISNTGYLLKNKIGKGYVTWFEAKKANPTPVPENMIYEGPHRNVNLTRAKFWQKYTHEQITAVEIICKLLCENYNIEYILGHEEIAPGRKTDPGPAFPLDELRNKLIGGPKKIRNFKNEIDNNIFVEEINDDNIDIEIATEYEDDMPDIDELIEEDDNKEFSLAQFGASMAKHSLSQTADFFTVGIVKVNLNFREKPSKNSNKLTDPIPAKTKVRIISKKIGWYEVAYKLKGWVSKEAVEHDNSDDGEGIVTVDDFILRSDKTMNAIKMRTPLKIGSKINILEQDEDEVLVYTIIKGWISDKYVKV